MIPYEKVYNKNFEDMPRRVPDITKLRNAIGFAPVRGLEEILKDVISHRCRGIVFKNCLDQLGTIGGDLIGRTILCDRQGRSEAHHFIAHAPACHVG